MFRILQDTFHLKVLLITNLYTYLIVSFLNVQKINSLNLAQLLLAFSLQLILVLVVIHGVRTEKRSLLLPYIIYTTVAILAGCAQVY